MLNPIAFAHLGLIGPRDPLVKDVSRIAALGSGLLAALT
jgi:hypothetical protein